MIKYIEGLKIRLENAKNKEEKNEVIKLLQEEKDSCHRILDEYSSRADRSWVKCWEVCNAEIAIIKTIEEILHAND